MCAVLSEKKAEVVVKGRKNWGERMKWVRSSSSEPQNHDPNGREGRGEISKGIGKKPVGRGSFRRVRRKGFLARRKLSF